MDAYHRWMEGTVYATFAGLPARTQRAVGLLCNGALARWPAGLQLLGPPQVDAALLRIAAGVEAVNGEMLARRPPAPSV